MAKFGQKSLDRLGTVHPDLQKVLNEAIHHFDFTVIYGIRTKEEQFELFKIGRSFENGQWIVTGKTVTNLDGKNKLSKHNHSPSLAVDVAPWPIDWSDIKRFKEMAKVIKKAADDCKIKIVWGGDWKTFKDFPHFELS